ncbi:hypothetical protein BMF77_01953 [Dolichospermum sp. UHCC 0315A]|uniref:hypothetical protein n=1 Tax=Dolichospermum sp. UHCC 0315A TaxID=1914871 RepID=UPI0011E7AE2A|nr:hypothetical protein [Dolichospermum sp. UHCC 0315A]QEI41368.1 hypothetical protein BMF77_01953 [Dolichospermum sp. UHCC 0315A]
MIEFIVIVESGADARTATKLAERVLKEKFDWLDDDILEYSFQWTGLEEGTGFSCWRDIIKIIDDAKSQIKYKPARFLGHNSKGEPLKADGAASIKILNLVRFLQRIRQIKAVIFIRDLDNQPERKEGIEQARSEHIDKMPKLEIIIGAADPKREAWVLNGFIPSNQQEEQILEEIKNKLSFDPCIESHRLRATSERESERIRNVKVVVEQLTGNDMEREKLCWEETSLKHLRERGVDTGLTDYICEVEERLAAIIVSD